MQTEAQSAGWWQGLLYGVAAYLGTFARLSPNARRLLLATACIYTSLGVFGVLFNLYLVDLGYSLAFVGLVAAVTTVGQAGISPLVGWALRRHGFRTMLAAGAALLVATLALSAIVTWSAGLAVATAASGMALSVVTIPAYPYMMEHARAPERAHLFSAYFAATTIGTMLGSLLSGALPALAAALLHAQGRGNVTADRIGLVGGALVTAAALWLFWRMREEAPSSDSADRPVQLLDEDAAEVHVRRDVLVMLAATAAIAMAMGAIMPFFNVYFSTRLHAGTATIGAIYALSGVACTVAAFLAPVVGRWGKLQGFSAARTLTGPIFMLFWLHPGLLAAAAGYVGRNTIGTISGALENTFAMEVLPSRLRGMVSSWRSFSFNGAWSLGSLLSGIVVARYGYDVIFLLGGVLTVAGSLTYYLRFARRARA